MTAKAKHPFPCSKCGAGTYRSGGVCRLCAPYEGRRRMHVHVLPAEFAQRISADLLEACAQEYLNRHLERVTALKKILERAA